MRKRSEHTVSRKDIDPAALKVLYRLNHAGFTAYLVGGGVRDLLLGRHPKDFDISTSAHPQEIRKLFRNSLLIGRRFRLVHVRFGDKVVETSTFRCDPAEGEQAPAEGDLYQHHDNTFGTPEEDARRRDFTINGLFYDLRSFDVIDHVGGLADLDARLVRCIGDPDIRFREDPVRMLRAVRFASRLGFAIEPGTYAAIRRHHAEILRASPPRLLEEILRLFAYGSGEAAFRLLRECGLLADLFPELDEWIAADGHGGSRVWACLAGLDRRTREGMDLNTAVKFAALFCAPFVDSLRAIRDEGGQPMYGEIASSLISGAAARFCVPKRAIQEFLHLLAVQPRLEESEPERARRRFVSFLAAGNAVLFHGLAAEAGCVSGKHLEAWRAACAEVPPAEARHARSPGRGPRGRPHAPGLPPGPGQPAPGQPARRRRRRRPRGSRHPEHHQPHGPGTFQDAQDFVAGG